MTREKILTPSEQRREKRNSLIVDRYKKYLELPEGERPKKMAFYKHVANEFLVSDIVVQRLAIDYDKRMRGGAKK